MGRKKLNKKAQAWGFDLMVAVAIFSIGITVFFIYSLNQPAQAKEILEKLSYDGKIITNSILSNGYPENWDSGNVVKIGILSDNKINETKLNRAYDLAKDNYEETKNLFNTNYDYFFFLKDESEVISFNPGACGIGNEEAIEVDISEFDVAYYIGKEKEMLDLTIGALFNLEIYCEDHEYYDDGTQACDKDVNGKTQLLANVDDYDLIILEDVHFKEVDFAILNPYVFDGGKVFISEHFDRDGFGIEYTNPNAGNPVTIVAPDPYGVLDLTLGGTYNIQDGPTVENNAGALGSEYVTNYVEIGTYASGEGGMVRWNYGSGYVYFFGDFDPTNIEDIIWKQDVINSITSLLTIDCDVEIAEVDTENLVKITRFVVYQDKPMTAYLYIWN